MRKAPRSIVAAAMAHLSFLSPVPDPLTRRRGEHWSNDSGTGFTNFWPSARSAPSFRDIAKFSWGGLGIKQPDLSDPHKFVGKATPDFSSPPPSTVKSTWLGHACVMVSFPPPPGADRGVNILFDPVFSQRCGPTIAPKRYTEVPCQDVSGLPEIDIVVISHNHYDHEDIPTLKALYAKQAARPPALFLPLNTARTIGAAGVPRESVVELDWWEHVDVDITGHGCVRVTCTPAQHMTARSPFDFAKSLWASWAVHSLNKAGEIGASVWFGGDTGYCATDSEAHEIDPTLPVCPEFKRIGERLGPFSLALIPIGAYGPRWFLSTVHCSPLDSVRLFKDIRAKKAIAIHWGTWNLSHEPVSEPPRLLAEAREIVGLKKEQFDVCALGESIVVDA